MRGQAIHRQSAEASLCLGYDQPGRHSQWQDEYYFALAVYGLASAKWPNYEKYWSESALISAGVAVAQMELARRVIRDQLDHKPSRATSYPSYRVPLYHAHKKWMAREFAAAAGVLKGACALFKHAVPLQVEQALVQADMGDLESAVRLMEPLITLGIVFGDYETLSRIGRVLKDFGDKSWQSHPQLPPWKPVFHRASTTPKRARSTPWRSLSAETISRAPTRRL